MADSGEKGGRLLLVADAYLLAALIYILATLVAVGVATLLVKGSIDESPLGIALQLGSMLLSVAAVIGGASWAWRLHGRPLYANVFVGMVIGGIAGLAVAIPFLAGVGFLLSRLPVSQDEPPWVAIGILAVLVVAFALVPVVAAVRDLRGEKAHARLDRLRLGAFVLVAVIAGVVLPLMGSAQNNEMGEAGVFMVPFAVGAGFAAAGADIFTRWLGREKTPPAPTVAG